MKKQLILFIILSTSIISYSQEFEFELVFKDAIGNTDTLVYGYDLTATNEIDVFFGETDIASNPITSVFDVRFSDVMTNGTLSPTHQSKKQIIPNDCPDWLLSDFGTSIEIFSNNYPITVNWNSSLFSDPCRIGTILTDVHPGGWFDTQGTFRTFLEQTISVTIDSPHYNYVNSQSQNVDVMWIAFMDSSVFDIPFNPVIFDPGWTSLNEYNNDVLEVYPNPVLNQLAINYPDKIKSIEIIDMQGQVVYSYLNFTESKLDLSILESGMYLVKFKTEFNSVITKRIVKK